MSDPARLLISCDDRTGIVAAVTGFLTARGANIITLDQYSTDASGGRFFMRVSFVGGGDPDELEEVFGASVGERFEMSWRLHRSGVVKRVALMVSKYDHCLFDLLWRWRRGELPMEVVCVVSNHEDFRVDVESFGLPFHVIPVEKGKKPEAESALVDLVGGQVDLVVLARYMQILSGDLIERLAAPIINIHHSFLPAFAGAAPYQRARERGVKLIGATAHYVTEVLDDGPIIEQDVLRVDHRATAEELERVGRDVERVALARAVRSHLHDLVLVDGTRTIVFPG
ncbi:MAG: formyltetrahydrofolate deformylase [Solirubrobacteraceae bacterium]|nr:formyltetrahydrofolate deformylase [Solirubrobacteraceae bacterium]